MHCWWWVSKLKRKKTADQYAEEAAVVFTQVRRHSRVFPTRSYFSNFFFNVDTYYMIINIISIVSCCCCLVFVFPSSFFLFYAVQYFLMYFLNLGVGGWNTQISPSPLSFVYFIIFSISHNWNCHPCVCVHHSVSCKSGTAVCIVQRIRATQTLDPSAWLSACYQCVQEIFQVLHKNIHTHKNSNCQDIITD